MATSDYDWNLTRNEIIERAFRLIGKLDAGDTLSGDQLNQAVIALNAMVKAWQSKHVYLWTLREFSQSLSAGTASYSLASSDPAVYAIDRAFLRINNDDDPVRVISWREYVDIENKTDSGDPDVCAIDNRISPTLYVYPVPTTTRTLYYLGMVKLKDFDTASGNADFPARWIQALTYGLAVELAPEYGVTGKEFDKLERKAGREFIEAKGGERERSEYECVKGAF